MQYSTKPGEKLYVVVPKPKPMTSSPFVPEKVPEKTLPPVNAVVPMNIKSRGVLATSEPPASSKATINEEITIKTELVIDNDFGNNNQKSPNTNNSLRLVFLNGQNMKKFLKNQPVFCLKTQGSNSEVLT